MECIDDFAYLGSVQSEDAGSAAGVARRMEITAGGMRNLRNIWFSQRMKIATKVRIYQLCVMTILLHCSETWTLTNACCSRLQSFHMWYQRQLMGVRWNDFVTSDFISSITGLDNVSTIIRARRLALLGHVARLDHVVQSVVGVLPSPGYRRPLGRARHTWVNHIKEDIAAPLDSVIHLAAD